MDYFTFNLKVDDLNACIFRKIFQTCKARFTPQLIKFLRESSNFRKLCVAVCIALRLFSGNTTFIDRT